jgi:hypothetical protein
MHATITYSPERKENDYKPGPGNYNPDSLKTKAKSPDYKVTKNSASQWRFGTEGRKGLVNRDAPHFPGSGQYSFKSMI